MSRETDLVVIAQQVLASAIGRYFDDICEMWESWPDLGEADWDAVTDLLEVLAPYPDAKQFSDAYGRRREACQQWLAKYPEAQS